MSTQNFLASTALAQADYLKICSYFIGLYVLYTIGISIYTAYLGPLRKFPGPRLRALSRLPELWTLATGTDAGDYVALHAKYGPVVRIAPNKLSYAEGAQSWKDIYGHRKHGQASMYHDPEFYSPPFNNVAGVHYADDANHSRQRKMMSHSFADKTLKELEPLLKHWVGLLMTKLGEKEAAGEKVNILKYYNLTTFDIMGDLSFGEDLGMLTSGEYSSWVTTIFESVKVGTQLRTFQLICKPADWLVKNLLLNNPKVQKIQAENFMYAADNVDRRLAKPPGRTDLWSKLLEKSDASEQGFTLGEHHTNGWFLMGAGTETTATLLSGVTYYLLRNPQYLEKLTEELRTAHATFEDISMESIQGLKYLRAVIQEGLRMYPPVPSLLPRKVPKGGAMVCGEFVPEGTSVGVHQLSAYRSETNFKNPHQFRPERWLGDPEYKDDRLDSLEPFSVGPRNCLGKNLAWHEMRLILASTLYSFDLQLCKEADGWHDQKIFTVWEKKPLMCTLARPQK